MPTLEETKTTNHVFKRLSDISPYHFACKNLKLFYNSFKEDNGKSFVMMIDKKAANLQDFKVMLSDYDNEFQNKNVNSKFFLKEFFSEEYYHELVNKLKQFENKNDLENIEDTKKKIEWALKGKDYLKFSVRLDLKNGIFMKKANELENKIIDSKELKDIPNYSLISFEAHLGKPYDISKVKSKGKGISGFLCFSNLMIIEPYSFNSRSIEDLQATLDTM